MTSPGVDVNLFKPLLLSLFLTAAALAQTPSGAQGPEISFQKSSVTVAVAA